MDYEEYIDYEVERLNMSFLKEIASLRMERDSFEKEMNEWKQKYFALLDDSINHGKKMSGLMLKAALEGAFKGKG